jgi:hypothetical protein
MRPVKHEKLGVGSVLALHKGHVVVWFTAHGVMVVPSTELVFL